MQGKAPIWYNRGVKTRITPAYAGKRLSRCRVRHGRTGSPPPMRGKEQWAKAAGIRAGITPAYAGKSRCDRRNRCSCEDHPRLCGEKFTTIRPISDFVGSPPPMRGKDIGYTDIDGAHGITPAYAGKRKQVRSR